MDMEWVGRSSDALELAGLFGLALGQPSVLPLRPKDRDVLEQFDPFSFGAGRVGWSVGEGPLVLLVHGYSGRGVQMAALAREIASQGFRAVFFDAGGHGISRVEKIGFFTFINDTRDILTHLAAPVFAMVGHSAGGLAMMRARALHGIAAERYAVIAAPLYPYIPLQTMLSAGATLESLEHVKSLLADQFQTSWSALVKGSCFTPEPAKLLLAIYDFDDERVRHEDANRLGDLWSAAQIIKTSGYGHNRILQAPETLQAVCSFLSAASSA